MISIILPCRNEEKSLDIVLAQIKDVIKKNKLDAEIIVSDSSIDKSPSIAKKHKVKLVKHNKKGYGIAYQEGVKAAKGNVFVMLDADATYDADDIPLMLKKINQGYDFVIGNRFGKKMDKDAMPFLHKYLGNPLLSFTLRMFFGAKVKDAHCGLRAIKREAYQKLDLKTTGMEYASEMVMKAMRKKLKIAQFPTKYSKREGDSKLNTFSDGWRHMKFMLLNSPLHLYTIPGSILFVFGILALSVLFFFDPIIFGFKLQQHPMFFASIITILGYQLLFFGLFVKTYYSLNFGGDELHEFYSVFNLEKALFFGCFLVFMSLIISSYVFFIWVRSGFGNLNGIETLVIALTLFSLGIQTIFSSFMISVLEIK